MKVDLTNDSAAQLDNTRLVAGWYLATCIGHEKRGDYEKLCWDFRIDSKLFHGITTDVELFNPELAQSPEDAKKSWASLKGAFKRLQLIRDEDCGKNVDVNLLACVGKQFVLRVDDNFFEGRNGERINYPRAKYYGIFRLDHPEIPPAQRAALGLPLLEGQTLDGPAAPAKAEKGKKPAKPAAPDGAVAPAALPPGFDASDV